MIAVSGAIGLAVAPGLASAQNEGAEEIEEVVVVGIRGSLQRSLDAKRFAESHVEVITAEDIGKMPDKNIADSLQRVPGVTTSAASANEGAFDENDRVSMRGTSPSYTQTLINGHNIASGDWFVLNQTGTVGRSVSYSLLPSELVSQVVVHKSYEAKLVEGGLTGSINIKTHSPLEFNDNFTVGANVGAVYSDLSEETDPQLSALVNWKNDAATIGIMLQGFSQTRHLRREGQEILGYNQMAATDAAAVAFPELSGVYYPSLIGSALFEQERKRIGGQLSLEIAPTDELTLLFNGFTSTLEADNYNRNYMLWGSAIVQRGAVPNADFVIRDNTLVDATFAADPTRQYGIYDEISRPGAESSSDYISAEFEWLPSDRWTFAGQIGTSDGRGQTPYQDVAEWDLGLGTGASWTLNGVGAADWNIGPTDETQPGTPGTDYRLDWIFGFQDIDVVDEEDWLQLDAEYMLEKGAFKSLEFGVRTADHERGVDQVTAQGPGCIDANGNVVAFDWGQQYFCPVGTQSPFDPANFPSGTSNYGAGFGSGLGGVFPRNIWYHSPAQLTEYNQLTNRNPVERFFFPGAYALEETASAAYLQLNLESDRWSGNFGLRYVRTENQVTNYFNADPTDPDAITTSAFGAFKPVVTENDFNDVLPTANFRLSLNDDMDLRLSATRTMTRADYSALSGAVSLSPPAAAGGVGSGTGGNPNLEPILSTNLDVSWEWYFADRALFAASVFYMDIDNYVSLGQELKTYITYDAQNPQGVPVDYLLTVPVNEAAKVKGFELAWQQPFGDNFGAFANFTYSDGETSDNSPMLGTSETTYNVGGYYETDRLSARINYNYRSSFYSGLDRDSAFFQDDVNTIDAAFGYGLTDQLTLTLDARNLGDEKVKYFAESRERPRSIYENGRQYYLTLRYNN